MHRPSNVATATRKKSSIGWVLLACSVRLQGYRHHRVHSRACRRIRAGGARCPAPSYVLDDGQRRTSATTSLPNGMHGGYRYSAEYQIERLMPDVPVAAQRSGNQRDPEASEDSKAGLRSPSMMCSCIAIAARGVVA